MKVLSSPLTRIILPSLVLLVGLRFIFWLTTFPNPDEAYYWLWGQHPALSYYDHPPLQAWVEGLFTAVFGKSFLGLRLPNLVSNIALFYTYYKISIYLYGERFFKFFGVTIAVLLASPLYFLFLALAWHDHLLITFCLLAAYLFVQFLDEYSGEVRSSHSVSFWRLYAAAAALGMAFLCKYNAVFVALGFLATVISQRSLRPLWRDRRFYLAGLITLSCLLPVLLWNIDNHFQSFQYYLSRSVDSGNGFHLKLGEPLVFWLVSVLTVSPINSWAMVQTIRLSKQPFQRPTLYRVTALWIFGLSTGILTAIAFVSTALYYWNITAYLLLLPLLPTVFLPENPNSNTLAQKPLLIAGQCYGLLFAVLLVIHYSIIPLSVFGSPDADPDSRMLFGWDTVEEAIQAERLDFDTNAFIITTDYRSASALAYQLDNPNVLAISDRVDQFDFWYHPDRLQGKNALILADDWHPVMPKLLAQFSKTSSPKTVSVTRFGKWIKNYYLLKGYGFRGKKEG